MSPAIPNFTRLRSAIVIVETETGETMQAVLTPAPWQPVEVQMDVAYDVELSTLSGVTIPANPIWTLTLTAGGYAGQLRTQQHHAAQSGPEAWRHDV